MERGYEDIYADSPYFDVEYDDKRALLHMMYVPPAMRTSGEGQRLFHQLLSELPTDIEYIRLMSAKLGSGCTMAFWKALGFSAAYANCDPDNEGRILHLGVNGFPCPDSEVLCDGDERHYIFD